MLKLMYITNDIDVAMVAQENGVDRIWIDLETKGKETRQAGMNTVKSHHCIEDIVKLRPYINKSELLVRINPWDENSPDEVEQVIQAGADIIMLPMWRTSNEVAAFVKQVNRRVKTMLLLETRDAENVLDEVVKINGIDEIHIGLNDLHLEYGLTFMFELLANGTVERICNKLASVGIPYGFGGVGRIGEGLLKADNIVVEHYRLGSSMVILSRNFCDTSIITDVNEIQNVFKMNIENMKSFERVVCTCYDESDFKKNQMSVADSVREVVNKIRNEGR